MTGTLSQSVSLCVKKLKHIYKKYKLEKGGYKYSLIDVKAETNKIVLDVLVLGIKKQILKFDPEEIVDDDELLSEFSPCDVRAITYLSFQKYINRELYSLVIEKQFINNGLTVFRIKNRNTNESFDLEAKKLYQDYDLLINLSKKDMIVVVSTAVQEQTFFDIKSMDA